MWIAVVERLRDVLEIFGLSRWISIGTSLVGSIFFGSFVLETSNLEFCFDNATWRCYPWLTCLCFWLSLDMEMDTCTLLQVCRKLLERLLLQQRSHRLVRGQVVHVLDRESWTNMKEPLYNTSRCLMTWCPWMFSSTWLFRESGPDANSRSPEAPGCFGDFWTVSLDFDWDKFGGFDFFGSFVLETSNLEFCFDNATWRCYPWLTCLCFWLSLDVEMDICTLWRVCRKLLERLPLRQTSHHLVRGQVVHVLDRESWTNMKEPLYNTWRCLMTWCPWIFSSTWLFRDSGPERAPIAEAECDCQSVGRCTVLPQRHYTRHIATFMLYLDAQWYASFCRICFFRFLQQHVRENLTSLARAVEQFGDSWETKTRQTMTGFDHLQSWDCKIAGVLLLPLLCGLVYRTMTTTASCFMHLDTVHLHALMSDYVLFQMTNWWCHDVMPIFVFSLDPGLQTGFHQDTFSEVQWVQWLQSFVPCVALWMPGCCYLLFEWHCVHSGLQDSMFQCQSLQETTWVTESPWVEFQESDRDCRVECPAWSSVEVTSDKGKG